MPKNHSQPKFPDKFVAVRKGIHLYGPFPSSVKAIEWLGNPEEIEEYWEVLSIYLPIHVGGVQECGTVVVHKKEIK